MVLLSTTCMYVSHDDVRVRSRSMNVRTYVCMYVLEYRTVLEYMHPAGRHKSVRTYLFLVSTYMWSGTFVQCIRATMERTSMMIQYHQLQAASWPSRWWCWSVMYVCCPRSCIVSCTVVELDYSTCIGVIRLWCCGTSTYSSTVVLLLEYVLEHPSEWVPLAY